MESEESIKRSGAAAFLRHLQPEILTEFTQRLPTQSHQSSCLWPILPDFFETLLRALDTDASLEIEPPPVWFKLPLGPAISELNLLRTVLGAYVSSPVDRARVHQFFDRCIELAAWAREQIEQEAQQRLFGFFQLIPTPVCVLMGDERLITFTNVAYDKFLGREAQGKTIHEVFTADELRPYLPYIDSVYAKGQPCFIREIYVPPSIGPVQRERWIDISYYPLGDVGLPRGVIALHFEVTDRVINRTRMERSELRLKQTEEQLSRAITVSKVGFFDWDLRYQLIHLNRHMRMDWGLDDEVMTADELEAVIHPSDREWTRRISLDALPQNSHFATQCRVVRKADGKVIWIEVDGEITWDDDNRPLRFFGTSRNITERKEAELKLTAEKHKFEVIFRDSPAPMALWRGDDFVCELVNPQFEDFFQDRSFIGRTLLDAIPEFENQPFLDYIRQVYETGETFAAKEYPLKLARCVDGPLELCYVDFTLARILDETGKPYGVFSHAVNVTDKVQARDEARAASLSKSHFLASMSHEIRTPLAAILGFSALLRDPQLPPAEREVFVDTIVRNGQALTRIIDDILDLAKVEAGRLELETIAFSLPLLIDEVLLLFKESAQQKHVQLSAHVDPNIPPLIASDPLRLRQILVNLVGNAIKFTQQGEVQIRCRSQTKEAGLLVTIDVQDTGIGLSLEQMTKLFQPFVQAENSTTRKFGGTGLGLALSQRLAEALGGCITIPRSAPGQGSTFSLQFEVQEEALHQQPKPTPASPALDGANLRGIRVLAVDDSPDNLFLVKSFLAKSGAIVASATGGYQAIAMAKAQVFDIILLDIQMPDLNGYQVIQVLREQGLGVPVVALTAHAMIAERHHTSEAGFSAHLSKPLDAMDLMATVARLVREFGAGKDPSLHH